MAYKYVPFFLSHVIIAELHWQSYGYILKKCWEVKYKDTLFIKFEPFP